MTTWDVFETQGGVDFFERLVQAFYERVAADEPLISLYPDRSDLDGARWRLTWFLVQYWGGPTTYSEARGHPRLRMRHVPYAIDLAMRDRWLASMAGALDQVDPPEAIRAILWEYFTMAAQSMVNHL